MYYCFPVKWFFYIVNIYKYVVWGLEDLYILFETILTSLFICYGFIVIFYSYGVTKLLLTLLVCLLVILCSWIIVISG